MLPEDKIWENAKDVWRNLTNGKFQSEYVQVYRILDKYIEVKGNNNFPVSGQNTFFGFRKELSFTENGNELTKEKMV